MSDPYADSCPEWVEITNRFLYAGAAAAIAALVVGLAAVLVLYAEGYRMMQARIMLGLFVANVLFSLSTVMLSGWWVYRDEPGTVDSCLESVDAGSSSPVVLVARALEPSSLLAIAMYEVGLMVASMVTLKKGVSYLPRHIEGRCHVGAVLAAVILAIGGLVKFSESGEDKDSQAYNTEFNTTAYKAEETQYMQFFRIGALCILVPAGLAVLGMWLYLRWFVGRLMEEWEAGRERATSLWRRDHWDTSSMQTQGLLRNKSLLLDLQREAWLEVARPLQKYCIVFLIFCPVYFVSATEMCVEKTVNPTYVKCLPVCSMLLSVRSLTTVLVFFADKQRRDTVYNFRALLATCWRRIRGTCARRCGVNLRGEDRPALADRIAFADELEDVREFNPQSTYDSSSCNGSVTSVHDYHLMEDAH